MKNYENLQRRLEDIGQKDQKTSTPSDGPPRPTKKQMTKKQNKKDERNWHKHDFPVKMTNFRSKNVSKTSQKRAKITKTRIFPDKKYR